LSAFGRLHRMVSGERTLLFSSALRGRLGVTGVQAAPRPNPDTSPTAAFKAIIREAATRSSYGQPRLFFDPPSVAEWPFYLRLVEKPARRAAPLADHFRAARVDQPARTNPKFSRALSIFLLTRVGPGRGPGQAGHSVPPDFFTFPGPVALELSFFEVAWLEPE